MLSLQLCLAIAPMLAGTEPRQESFQSLSSTIPYHLIAQADGRLQATLVVLTTDDDDDEDEDDDDDDDREGGRREEHGSRRDGDARRPESEDKHDGDRRKPEDRRPQPERSEGHRPDAHRPEGHRPDGAGRPHGPGEHKPQPDHHGLPHQPQHDRQPSPPQGPHAPGGFHPPMMGMGMPNFGRAFGGGSPFGGMPPGHPSAHGPGGSVLAGIIFELLDQNHDGNLSRVEFQKLADAVEKSHHPRLNIPTNAGPGKAPDGDHGRPQLSRRIGPPMIHQPMPLHQAHKPDGDRRPDASHRPGGEHDRKPEHSDKGEHREHGEREGDRPRPDGERGEKSREHQEPRI